MCTNNKLTMKSTIELILVFVPLFGLPDFTTNTKIHSKDYHFKKVFGNLRETLGYLINRYSEIR